MSSDYAWALCSYVSSHHSRAAFDAIERWVSARNLDLSVMHGLIDGRPSVAVGVPFADAHVLLDVPFGPEAINVPMRPVMAEALWRRRVQSTQGREPGQSVVRHHATDKYLHPDGTLHDAPAPREDP
jgi:hypothetical protein